MAITNKSRKFGWKDIEKKISQFDRAELAELLFDLFRLSSDNKNFFFTRFSIGDDPLANYKTIIRKAMHPSIEMDERLDIETAKAAISRYSKAIDYPPGEAELRLYFVECGNNFTLTYGDIDEDFYDALLEMFEYAIETVLELTPKAQAAFKVRLEKVVKSAQGIGWGYYDGLCDLFREAFSGI